jgi:hypothetical protein
MPTRPPAPLDPPLATPRDRWSSETLVQVDGVHPDAARVMLTRIAIMFEVVADRRGWPERMRWFMANELIRPIDAGSAHAIEEASDH